MTVHDVDMNPVGARGIDGSHLVAQFRKIGGKDRWGDDERPGHWTLQDYGFA
jgi:hypothetical protein